VSSDRLLH